MVHTAAELGAFAIIGIMIITIADIVVREFAGGSIPGVLDIGTTLLVMAATLGLAGAERSRQHVRTDVITNILPKRLVRPSRVVGLIVTLIFLGLVTWESVFNAISSTLKGETRFGLAQVPVWPGRIALALGFLLLTIEVGRELRWLLVEHRNVILVEYGHEGE